MMTSGSTKLSNCAASTRKTIRSASAKVTGQRRRASLNCCDCPRERICGLGGSARPGGLFEIVDRLAEHRSLGASAGGERDRGQAVVAAERRRGRLLVDRDERAERHQRLAVASADEDVGDVVGRLAVVVLGLHHDRVFAAAVDKGRHLARGEHGLQRRGDGLDADTEVVGALAVDSTSAAAGSPRNRARGSRSAGIVLGGGASMWRPLLHVLEIGAARRRRGAAWCCRASPARPAHRDAPRAPITWLVASHQAADHRVLRRVALIPRLHAEDDEGAIGALLAADQRR